MVSEDKGNEKKLIDVYNSVGGRARKRILLTTSAAPAQAPFSTSEKRPPIGIGFLISVLRNAGHEVSFIDNYLKPTNFIETGYLQKNNIEYIGIYINTICFRDTLRMLHKIQYLRKTGQWQGKIIVGGPHTTVAQGTIPEFVDYVVQGEGENAILDIVEGKVTQRIVNYPRIENLDALPMPAWDCFARLPYDWSAKFFDEKPVFTMNTSRGCPFRCTFCSVGSIWGKKYTYFSAERIVSDIEYLIKNYGARGIYFREDNFTLNKSRLERFCNLIIEKGINISWACESRVSNLDRDVIELMSRAGLKGFYFGVESGSQRILDLLHKDITVEQIKNAFNWCHEFNIKAAASVIVGVPGETEADRQKTNELLNEIKPDTVWTNVFVGIPNSSLYQCVLKDRLYEYIDDRGLVYLQGHNYRAGRYYNNGLNAFIPDEEKRKDMANKPRISVLISVHNTESYIEEALRSIYNQTCQDFEVVIIDDASTDGTSEILLKMKDRRTVIYRNSVNRGLTKSLNIGLKLCRGEYVARMDADDISHPQRFERQVKFLEENPDCAAVGSWCYRIDADGKIHGAYDRRPTSPEDIKNRLLAGNCIAHTTAMIRKAAFVKIGGYNDKYMYAQDHDLWLRLSEVADLWNIEEYLVGLRFWPGNITAIKRDQQDKFSRLAIQEALVRRDISELPTAGGGIKCCNHQGSYQPKFSIVMANYNNGKYIAEAIESVLKQTFNDWELIIVEDCSSDNSLEVIGKYLDDSRVRLVQHKHNQGYTASLKTGIANMRSDYFGILDSDDCLTLSAIEIMYSAHVRLPDTGLIYSQFMSCDEKLVPRQIGFGAAIPPGKTDLDNHVATALRTFKKRDYLKTSGYDEDILYAEDRDICYKMEEVTKLKFINQCLYLYRELPNSQSRDPAKAFIGRQLREKARVNALIRRGLLPSLNKEQTGKTVTAGQYNVKDRYKFTKEVVDLQAEPVVSVIMPAYNAADYIAKAISGVLNQTYKNFELIVINDGSTDQTENIILSFNDQRIKYSRQENHGLAATHNTGIRKSAGEFVIKLDADDMMTPDFIERHIAEFERHTEADLVYCDDLLIDERNQPVRVINRPEYSDRKQLIRDLFRCGFPVVPFRTCIRKNVFDKIGYFDESLRVAEDYDMMRRFVKHGLRVHHLPAALYLRRIASDSLSRKFSVEKAKSHFDIVKRYSDTFACEELFPDVDWNKIAPEKRKMQAKCLSAVTCFTIGQSYVKTAPVYAKTAFDQACSELNECFRMDQANPLVQQLLRKYEALRTHCEQAVQEAVY